MIQGFAKKKFIETYQRTPWFSKQTILQHQWPFLELFLAQHRVSYLDYDLTHRLLRDFPNAKQETALFLCHLIIAAKEGHLCVHVCENTITPSVQELWQNDEGNPLSDAEAATITQLMLIGITQIPEKLITYRNHSDDSIPKTPLCQEGDDFYLQRFWVYETLFLTNLNRHLQSSPIPALDHTIAEKNIQQLCQEGILLEEQGNAILQSSMHPLTLITGGPGTGKTFTAGHLIKVFWQLLTDEQRNDCQIILAAPTGKAAANLQSSLNKVTGSLTGFPLLQAKTLHALLGLNPSSKVRETIQLSADLIVVDESSMMDVRMMASLFEALKPGSRLILLGDKHQLPAIEAGSLFHDLLDLQIPSITLSKCMRAELKTLVDFAQLINQGRSSDLIEKLNENSGIQRLHFSEDKKKGQSDFISHATPLYPSIIHFGQKPEDLLNLFQSIRILSPVRKGPFGVETLNQLIWQKICQKIPMNGYIAIPIMITANDYRQELFNGETGILIRRLPLHTLTSEDYALFPSKLSDGKARRVSAFLLPKYELAYCLSVHKSQGSEFDHVILAMPEGTELFGREIFYTAVTRARKRLEIYGSDLIIQKTIDHQGIRHSGLVHRAKETFSLKASVDSI